MWTLEKEFCLSSMIHQGGIEIRGQKPIATHIKFTSWLTGFQHVITYKLGCE